MPQFDRYQGMSTSAQITRHRRAHPDRIALTFEGRDLTYEQLDRRVNRLARTLQKSGVEAGDRVAILMYNRLEFLEVLFAAARIGAIAVPVNFRLTSPEVRWILDNCGADVVAVDDDVADVARGAVADREGVTVLLAGERTDGFGRVLLYEDALDPDDSPAATVVPDDEPAVIMYTSGTTGRPKGAVLTHRNLTMNSINSVVSQRVGVDGEVWYAGLPLFHIGGLSGVLNILFVGGRSIVGSTGNFDARSTVDTLERLQVTSCFFVPTQWAEICALPGITERRLALRTLSWGASIAPLGVLLAMSEVFPNVPKYNAFGQTETSPVTCLLLGEDAERKMGSIGTPILNVEVRIVDPEMNDVAVGEVGEIVYRGPTVMNGYWNNPEATAEAFRGGWFHSGDLCRVDEDGFLWIVDRAKDMIISGGENIYSAEVEAAIQSHPKVREVSVVGAPHPKWVETPIAVVVAEDPSAPPDLDEIVEHCREHLASYKKPTGLVVVDELPRNATGKIQKFMLREMLVDA